MLLTLLSASWALPASSGDFVEFETGPVRTMASSTDGSELYVVNIPDNQLEIFAVGDEGLTRTATVQVGMEPCAVAVAPDGKVWVVNHLSDSVSVVDVAATPPQVVHTLLVGDEPRDIVFAGTTQDRAFITTAHRGQHRMHPSIDGFVAGGGDPQFSTEGIGRADVWVFNVATLGFSVGGDPAAILSFFTDTPRSLAVSNDGAHVYVAGFHSGNQTTVISELLVCDGFNPNQGCTDPLTGILNLPGGADSPPDNVFGAPAPEPGAILKWDNGLEQWLDSAGNNWKPFVMYTLPDHDVFKVSADSLDVAGAVEFDHVGTILFNMAVNPVTGNVYVSNTELPNHVNFEGPGNHGGSTVQGHLSESRISVLNGAGNVTPRHLNSHIDYSRLHTDVPDIVDTTAKNHSLATPVDMVVSSDGQTLYVSAYGSAKVGVIDVSQLELGTFDPTVASANYIPTDGGPNGLVLDESRNRLYVTTRFDNAVSVIDLSDNSTLQSVALHNPEPASVVEGRPFLYDAFNTSGNGEASCASCHIFGDMDSLAWNLGNPDDAVTDNNQPVAQNASNGQNTTFHPMKGPMTTQTLRGLATHGAMHWRGDRLEGFFGEDDCVETVGAPCIEEHSFKNFIVAFEGLVGKDGPLDGVSMQKFSDFALQISLPPNPVRNIDNTLNAQQALGLDVYDDPNQDGAASCENCHRLDPLNGFYGTGGEQSFEGLTQNMKVPHLRNAYQKVGMFGMLVFPDFDLGKFNIKTGDQVRGVGYLHDGVVDTVAHFIGATLFNTDETEEEALEELVFAFDTDLAPIVGQQVTLSPSNNTTAGARIDLLLAQADDPFDSLMLGGSVVECDVIVKGHVGGVPRGWLWRPGTSDYIDDTGATITDAALRILAFTEGPLTWTAVPPGAGTRMGINRDRDTLLDGVDNCADADNDDQTDTDGDAMGDACDQDDDGDSLFDAYETGTGIFVSAFDTGTDPLLEDTDGDTYLDAFEIAAGTDPNNAASNPGGGPLVPALWGWGLVALGLSLSGSAGMVSLRRKPGAS